MENTAGRSAGLPEIAHPSRSAGLLAPTGVDGVPTPGTPLPPTCPRGRSGHRETHDQRVAAAPVSCLWLDLPAPAHRSRGVCQPADEPATPNPPAARLPDSGPD